MTTAQGKKMRSLRRELGWSQKTLAEHLGINQTNASFYENAKRDVPQDIWGKFEAIQKANKSNGNSSGKTSIPVEAGSNGKAQETPASTRVPELRQELANQRAAAQEAPAEPPVVPTTPELADLALVDVPVSPVADMDPEHWRVTLHMLTNRLGTDDAFRKVVWVALVKQDEIRAINNLIDSLETEELEEAFLTVMRLYST